LREDLRGYLLNPLPPSLNRRQKSQLRKKKWLKTRKKTKRTKGRPRNLQSQRPMRRTTQKMEKPRATR
ncbi:Zeaxanthin epoxidase, partial [Clarias magur]